MRLDGLVEFVESRWTLVVPVKRLGDAKSRLGVANRDRLALAFARDVVESAASCPSVQRVIVVTDDIDVEQALRGSGAEVVADPAAGLNAAVRAGALAAPEGSPVGALLGDLPSIRPEELSEALRDAAQHDRAFVSDAAGTGTTLLTARPGVDLDPRFGPRSHAAHAASGAVDITRPGLRGLLRDVDTEVDLWDALRIGVGPATAEAARQ